MAAGEEEELASVALERRTLVVVLGSVSAAFEGVSTVVAGLLRVFRGLAEGGPAEGDVVEGLELWPGAGEGEAGAGTALGRRTLVLALDAFEAALAF